MAFWMAQAVLDYAGPTEQYIYASEEEAQNKADEMQAYHGGRDRSGVEVFVVGPIGFGVNLDDAPRRSLEPSKQKKISKTSHDKHEQVEGFSFDKFMHGVVEGEEKKRARKVLNEDSPNRLYIKKYGELAQNRISYKK
jgi:hypothetical protein